MLFERQQYQEDCVNNIVATLRGSEQPSNLTAEKASLRAVQVEKSIPVTDLSEQNRLDVLMETGTGKTFTYLKTMYELNKEYGTSKFVVFVPRAAIREGIIQNINLTADYFFREYRKRIKLHVYNSASKRTGGLAQIASFVRTKNELSVLILTSSSIDKPTNKNSKGNILRRQHENIGRENSTPLDAIAELSPVIFIDEPHLLKGEKFVESYNEFFSDLLCIRFGATFPSAAEFKLTNVVYTLDSLSAFRQNLVKKIRVSTIINAESGIKFSTVLARQKQATIFYFKDNIEYYKTIKFGQDIGTAIDDKHCSGLHILRATKKKIFLSDHTERSTESDYEISDEAIQQMVRHTIKIHFTKEARLFKHEIKTLSLFFIPNVRDFREGSANSLPPPRIKRIFEQEYKKIRTARLRDKSLNKAYRAYLEKDYDAEGNLRVHGGYFSVDSGTKEAQEASSVELILKKKEQLLSFDTPLRFIFSVWALQEGWDNPNIFTLCKLACTHTETSRRQQVGRGLRLAVNQKGKRQTHRYCEQNDLPFDDINTLDVIVSGQEKNFIEGIQEEIQQSSYCFGGDVISRAALDALPLDMQQKNRLMLALEDWDVVKFDELADQWIVRSSVLEFLQQNRAQLPPRLIEKYEELVNFFSQSTKSPVENANKKVVKVDIRQARAQQFHELWKSITRKAKRTYRDIDEAALKKSICASFEKEPIAQKKIILRRQKLNPQTNAVENEREETLGNAEFFRKPAYYAEFVLEFAKRTKLPVAFAVDLFNCLSADSRAKIKNNPKRADEFLQKIFKEEVHANIVQKIGYQFESEINISNYSLLYSKDGSPRSQIESSHLGRYLEDGSAPPHYLYDKVVFDSNIERDAIKNDPKQVNLHKIKVFAKLPRISIPTPYKTYNPDFAYYIETETSKKIFLVVETKGYARESDIPQDEQVKIKYAKKFFDALQHHMPNATIEYKSRINQQQLHELLEEIGK